MATNPRLEFPISNPDADVLTWVTQHPRLFRGVVGVDLRLVLPMAVGRYQPDPVEVETEVEVGTVTTKAAQGIRLYGFTAETEGYAARIIYRILQKLIAASRWDGVLCRDYCHIRYGLDSVAADGDQFYVPRRGFLGLQPPNGGWIESQGGAVFRGGVTLNFQELRG